MHCCGKRFSETQRTADTISVRDIGGVAEQVVLDVVTAYVQDRHIGVVGALYQLAELGQTIPGPVCRRKDELPCAVKSTFPALAVAFKIMRTGGVFVSYLAPFGWSVDIPDIELLAGRIKSSTKSHRPCGVAILERSAPTGFREQWNVVCALRPLHAHVREAAQEAVERAPVKHRQPHDGGVVVLRREELVQGVV